MAFAPTDDVTPAPPSRTRFLLAATLLLLGAASPAWSDTGRGVASDRLLDLTNWLATPASARRGSAPALSRPLSRAAAGRALYLLAQDRRRTVATAERDMIAAKALTLGDKTLKWESRRFGDAPIGKRSLWISLHGGGNAPAAVNEGQWRNQVALYRPAEGIYLAPRAPTDTWNLWHEPHIDAMLQRLIDAAVAIEGVDPDRVYLLGYSAGGDGVWQLAPRMADRFAAAATMAGHPGDAPLASLRNLPFAILMGGEDAAYDRNRVAAEKADALARLRAADPGGYTHLSRIYPGLPHWMNRRDAEALPWMARFTRDPWPRRIAWVQDDVPGTRFYWLRLPPGAPAKAGSRIDARVDGQRIMLDGDVPDGIELRLSDRLLDLDRPVTLVVNGRAAFRGRVPRTAAAIRTSLQERNDPASAATALLRVNAARDGE